MEERRPIDVIDDSVVRCFHVEIAKAEFLPHIGWLGF
jgi:hypothetical protein